MPFCVKHLVNEVFLCVHHTLAAFMLSFLTFSVQDTKFILVSQVCTGSNIININYVMFTYVFTRNLECIACSIHVRIVATSFKVTLCLSVNKAITGQFYRKSLLGVISHA